MLKLKLWKAKNHIKHWLKHKTFNCGFDIEQKWLTIAFPTLSQWTEHLSQVSLQSLKKCGRYGAGKKNAGSNIW